MNLFYSYSIVCTFFSFLTDDWSMNEKPVKTLTRQGWKISQEMLTDLGVINQSYSLYLQ